MRKFLSLIVLLVLAITVQAKVVTVYVAAEGFQPYLYAWVKDTTPLQKPLGAWPGTKLTKTVFLTNNSGQTREFYTKTFSYDGENPVNFVIHDNNKKTQNIENQKHSSHYYIVRYDGGISEGMHYEEVTAQYQPTSISSVTIPSAFNKWSTSATSATPGGNNTWTFTYTGGSTSFKIHVNGEWVGADAINLTSDLLSDAGGTNHDINFNAEADQAYTVTLTWNPNASASEGWSVNVTTVGPTKVPVTSALYATYAFNGYTDYADNRTNLTAYTVKVENGRAKLNAISGTVPPMTPVVIKGNEAKNYDVYAYAYTASTADVSNNDLKLSDGSVKGDGSTIYVLGNKSKGVGFYLATANNTVPAGRCYLVIPASSGAKDFISFDEETTAINNFKAENVETSAIYNLQGVQVDENYKGIVVKNGKKFINK